MQDGDLLWFAYVAIAGLIAGLLSYKLGIIGAIVGVLIVWAAMIARIDILFHYRGSNPEANALYFFLGWIPGIFWCGFWYAVRIIRREYKKDLDP